MDPTLLRVLSGSLLIGVAGGVLGTFAYLRRRALIGDVVSHASLLGVVAGFWLSYVITGEASKSVWVVAPAAVIAGVLAAGLLSAVRATTPVKEDAAMGVALAVFFGGGMTWLRIIQRSSPPIEGRGGLDGYLFGMAAATTADDVLAMAAVVVALVAVVGVLWHRLKWVTFDPMAAAVARVPVRRYEALQVAMMVAAIVVSVQIVGVVLMVAVLIAPAAAARQWTRSLAAMTVAAALIGGVGAAAGVGLGTLPGAGGGSLPTGPVIVLTLSAVVAIARVTSRRTVVA